MNPPPSSAARVLGVVGVVGGLALISAFLPIAIPDDLNTLRLAVFNVGAIAVAVVVARTAGAGRRSLAVIAAAVVLANAWYLVMTVVATTVARPFAGDFGLVYFWAGVAMWLAGFGAWVSPSFAVRGSGRWDPSLLVSVPCSPSSGWTGWDSRPPRAGRSSASWRSSGSSSTALAGSSWGSSSRSLNVSARSRALPVDDRSRSPCHSPPGP